MYSILISIAKNKKLNTGNYLYKIICYNKYITPENSTSSTQKLNNLSNFLHLTFIL